MENKQIGAQEKALIDKEKKKRQASISKLNRLFIYGSIAIWVLAIIAYFNDDSEMDLLLIGASILQLVAFWNYAKEKGMRKKMLKDLRYLEENNDFLNTRVRSQRVYHFQGQSRADDVYLYELPGNRLLSISGAWAGTNADFPNSDLEVIVGRNKEKNPMLWEILCYGQKVEPVKKLSGTAKQKLIGSGLLPDPFKQEIIEGNLDLVDEVLLS